MIPMDVVGRIASGHQQGRFVKILPPGLSQTSGYLILINDQEDMQGNGGDYWVETREDLDGFFEEANWVVEWPD